MNAYERTQLLKFKSARCSSGDYDGPTGPTGATGATGGFSGVLYQSIIPDTGSAYTIGDTGSHILSLFTDNGYFGESIYLYDATNNVYLPIRVENGTIYINNLPPAGIRITGYVATLQDLYNLESIVEGDVYVVGDNSHLYLATVDNPSQSDWQDLGEIVGPQGATGPTGSTGPTGPSGTPGSLYNLYIIKVILSATGTITGATFSGKDPQGNNLLANGWSISVLNDTDFSVIYPASFTGTFMNFKRFVDMNAEDIYFVSNMSVSSTSGQTCSYDPSIRTITFSKFTNALAGINTSTSTNLYIAFDYATQNIFF